MVIVGFRIHIELLSHKLEVDPTCKIPTLSSVIWLTIKSFFEVINSNSSLT